MPRLLVVSHPAVLNVNQLPYEELARAGWDVSLVVPRLWQHEYVAGTFEAEAPPDGDLMDFRPTDIWFPGRVQRHIYRARVKRVIEEIAPDVAFVEAEPTSLAAAQWGVALRRAGVPFALQADENLERPYHPVARAIRQWSVRAAGFIAARSPKAAEVLRRRWAQVDAPVIPHPVPLWDVPKKVHGDRPFTVGYAGRLIEAKGVDDLLGAVRGMEHARLLVVGNGDLLDRVRGTDLAGVDLEVRTDVRHGDMAGAYADMDILVLPSRSTPTWEEQFGRVLVEAMWCGVPVIGAATGEIPWVIETSGGGLVVPERAPTLLRSAIDELRADPERRAALAERGARSVEAHFSVAAVAGMLDTSLRGIHGASS